MPDTQRISEVTGALAADEQRAPADEDQRHRIRTERAENLFVEAGAGTGKTRALVERVEALVLEDGVPMESIAMITFTEKAATELRDRIRQRFEGSDNPREQAAIQQLDGAAVGTLHSFAQRILAEHPVEAGLPPGIEVLDEIGSQVEFENQWRQFLDELLDDQSAARSLLSLETAGVKLDHLRSLALQMTDNWDLVEERLDLDPPQPKPIDADALISHFKEVVELRRYCTNDSDKLVEHLDRVEKNQDELSNAFDHIEALSLAADMGDKPKSSRAVKPGRVGKAANWDIDVGKVRDAMKELRERCDEAVGEVTTAALGYVGARLGNFVLTAVEERRQSGRLQFHDLLVRARQLLRDKQVGAEVRASLHRQYTHLLLDEFQDTDPIQIEIAVLIATAEPAVDDREWFDLEVAPGRLFLVGDPKQSIYRFRRADIRVYLEARERFGERPALTVNFRTVKPIITWINDVFSELIEASPGSQPEYAALSPYRSSVDPTGPAVAVLGAEPIEGRLNADELRKAESADVAATVAEVLGGADPWQIEDPDEGWRAARPRDICILLPSRISLSSLERALEANGVPYRAETSSLVYATREVRELMLTLRAISDPTDELATVAALRSFVYGCGDDDLANWRLEHRGGFSLQAPISNDKQGHPVADALLHLQTLHIDRIWLTPAGLLERVIRERAVLESAVATGAPRDVWRRLRFVADQARAWADAGGTDLRSYLEWARLQGADNARVSETVLPETDDDSVRIMTIHGAKGLEFPITVMAGMTTMFQRPQRGPAVLFPPGQPALLKVSSRVASERYDEWKSFNDTMDEHERLRLLYVAATRTRDHLIVCLHRLNSGYNTSAKVLAEHALASESATPFVPTRTGVQPPKRAVRQPLVERGEWAAKLSEAADVSRRRMVVSATALAREAAQATDPGLDKRARNLDLPPWLKGRYGTAIGRSVHGVLQVVDLATGDGLAQAAAAQAAAEGVDNRRSTVEQLARAGLESQAAKAASTAEHWREVWVAATVGDRLVEGYIDLLYRSASGLVVVDWKTDHVEGDDDIAAKLDRYRLQGAAYVAAIEAATGLTVERMAFVFLGEDGAIERDLPDLRRAVAEVQQRTRELAELSGLANQDLDL